MSRKHTEAALNAEIARLRRLNVEAEECAKHWKNTADGLLKALLELKEDVIVIKENSTYWEDTVMTLRHKNESYSKGLKISEDISAGLKLDKTRLTAENVRLSQEIHGFLG